MAGNTVNRAYAVYMKLIKDAKVWQRRTDMENSKEELIRKIESARLILNKSIDEKRNYEEIYQNSIALDALIEEYIIAGY